MKRKVLLILVFSTFCLLNGCSKEKEIKNINNEKTTTITTTEVTADESNKSEIKTQINTEDVLTFIPKGWHLLIKDYEQEPVIAEGDLNKDGIIDKSFVIEEDSEDEESELLSAKRQLVLLTGKNDGTYSLELIAENAILSEIDGGTFGDPVNAIEINNGSLFLRFIGGSSQRWYSSYQFRYQGNGWFLIGATEGSYVEIDGKIDNVQDDYNLLTGDYIFKKFVNGKIVTTRGNKTKQELIKLEEFSIQYESKSKF